MEAQNSQRVVRATERLKTTKKRTIIQSAVGFFLLSLLSDWLGIGPHEHLPSTLGGWIVVLVMTAMEAMTFGILFYFAFFAVIYFFGRFFFNESGRDMARGHKADGKREA